MEDEFKTPNQSDEFKPNDEPYQDEAVERFEQNESDGSINQSEQEESIEPMEDINQIESIVEPEPDSEQKIEVAHFTKPTEIVDSAAAETVEAVKLEQEIVKPAENIPPISNNEVKKTVKKGFAKKLLTVIVVIILMVLSAAAAYWWRDKQAVEFEKTQTESTQALQQKFDTITANLGDKDNSTVNNGDSVTLCDDVVECLPVAPTRSILDNIKGVITTANTQPLEGYMADDATTITATTSGVSSSSSNGTISTITDFLEESSRVWDFNLSDLEVDSYKAGSYGTYFDNATIIGKSADGEVVAITFDCNSKIHETLLVADENIVH